MVGPIDWSAFDEKVIRERIRNHPRLKGTDAYVIKVDGPSGSGYAPSTTAIYQAYFDTITIHMVLRKP